MTPLRTTLVEGRVKLCNCNRLGITVNHLAN